MLHFENQIITASAGTGKTYRLSLEYIALILSYYKVEGFSLDSILALTFTRKATYEIRERILLQLESLDNGTDAGLAQNLCKMLQRKDTALSATDREIIASARRQILNDSRYLQVGTIDSYIAQIFRNIVCPLRSIDEYEIDLGAIEKRMPFLMEHLMQPAILTKVDKLLRRKVLRSMDDYSNFFASMIEERWLYYLIRHRCPLNNLNIPERDHHGIFQQAILGFCESLGEIALQKKVAIYNLLNAPVLRLLDAEPQYAADLYQSLITFLDKPLEANRLLKEIAAGNCFNRIRIKSEDHRSVLQGYLLQATEALADHLYQELFLPQQEEILQLWEIILKEYDRLIYRYKNMTYDDISWFTFEALFSQDPPNFDLSFENTATEFYHFLSHRTRFLLIDEFQDTSLIQFNILKPIMEEICAGYGSRDFGGMIVVGDEKQSIFGWRGGERDLLLNLRYLIGSLQNAREDKLDTSYRSTEGLIDFINTIFSDAALHRYLQTNQMKWKYQNVKSGIGKLPGRLEYKCAAYSSKLDLQSKDDVYLDFVNSMIKPVWNAESDEKIAILCRKTDQLSDLQLILEESGMGGVFQPSESIVNHHLIQPLISWMRFVCYGDYYDLLGFLRSDYLLLGSDALKYLVDALAHYEYELKEGKYHAQPVLDAYPALTDWFCLATKQRTQSPYQSLREILSLILTDNLQKSKRDRLNLEAFLAMVRDWELAQATQGAHLPELLDYIEDNSQQEAWNQVSVEGEEKLQLLTIHKSKGLQFDRVFVFFNLSSMGGGAIDRELFWAYRYADIAGADGEAISSLHHLDAYALSYHHQDVLKLSSARSLWEAKERQALLEELNNLYVAITRAKSSLHLYFCYQNQKGWLEYFAEKMAEDSSKRILPMLIAESCRQYFAATTPDEYGVYRQDLHPDSSRQPDAAGQSLQVKNLFLKSETLAKADGLNWQRTLPLTEILHQDWQTVYIRRPQHLYGDILHYYFSFLLRDTEDEHRLAIRHCLKRYGSLQPESKIRELCTTGRRKLQEYSYLFAQEYDKVFTELPVKAYRIDRLMLNTAKKEALVIDYKTGRISEPEQLENYVKALKELPAFEGYRFECQYIKL